MRADYSTIIDIIASEEEKLDKHWTQNWDSIGNQRRAQWKIRLGPEYRVLKKFAPKLHHGLGPARVLDGGCGLGEWCLLLKDLGFEPYGLDISTSTIEMLKSTFPKMHFVRDDIRTTSFPDNYFDLYISWGTFEHFENGLNDCFAEALRIIKPGGKLIITVPFYNNRLKAIDAGRSISQPENTEFYQWRLEKEELLQEFEKGGFICEHSEPIYTHEGLSRHLHHRYGLPYGRLNKYTSMALSVFAPANYFAHMLIGVGTKPAS